MSHHIFYNQIKNQITTELLKKPEYLSEIEQKISFEKNETIYSLSSEAAHIFYTIQNLVAFKAPADITEATQNYASIILAHFIKGEKLPAFELILATVETIAPFV